MGLIEDANGKPLQVEEEPKNGKSEKDPQMMDARLIPRGLLTYNLMMVTQNLYMSGIQLEQMQMMMQQQRMVTEPPPITQLKEQIAELRRTRDIIVTDLNARYADADAAYWAKLDLKVEDRTEAEV